MTNRVDFSEDEDLLKHFIDYRATSLDSLKQCVNSLEQKGVQEQILAQIYSESHNVKGMAASFGYDLLTDICANLCLYLKRRKEQPVDICLIKSHISVFDAIVVHDIKGNGGEKGQAVLFQLRQKLETGGFPDGHQS